MARKLVLSVVLADSLIQSQAMVQRRRELPITSWESSISGEFRRMLTCSRLALSGALNQESNYDFQVD